MRFISTKSVIALAALAASGASFAQATAAAPAFTLYGRFDVVLENSDDGSVSHTLVQDQSSRIGVRGEQSISGDLSAIMQLETKFAPDDNNNSAALGSRNSFVGLKSKSMGSIIIGTNDMPFKSLEGTASQLWGSAEAMEVITHGKGTDAALGGAWVNLHTRQKNVVLYTSPKFSNIVAKLAYSPDECVTAAGATSCPTSKSVNGASIEYNDGMYNLGLATESKENANTSGTSIGSMTGTKLTAGFKMGDWTAGVAYSNLDNSIGKKTDNILLTGVYSMGPVALKANYGTSSESSSGADDAVNMLGLEVDYALERGVTLYSYYTSIDNGAKATGKFENGATTFPVAAGKDPKAFGAGIRYNF